MYYTTDPAINKIATSLLIKHDLVPPINFEIPINEIIKFKLIDGKFSGSYCWIYVLLDDLLIIFFGNLSTGDNYTFTPMPIIKGREHGWFILIRGLLHARKIREQLQGNYSAVTNGNNVWTMSGEYNDKH